jgi:hypothetical protein
VASADLISVCEIPNCRAIAEGLTRVASAEPNDREQQQSGRCKGWSRVDHLDWTTWTPMRWMPPLGVCGFDRERRLWWRADGLGWDGEGLGSRTRLVAGLALVPRLVAGRERRAEQKYQKKLPVESLKREPNKNIKARGLSRDLSRTTKSVGQSASHLDCGYLDCGAGVRSRTVSHARSLTRTGSPRGCLCVGCRPLRSRQKSSAKWRCSLVRIV